MSDEQNSGQDESQATTPGVEAPAENPPSPASPKQLGDDISVLLDQAQQALDSVQKPREPQIDGIAPFDLQDFGGTPPTTEKATLELLRDVELDLKIELGRTHMLLEDVLRLQQGSVVSLDRLAGDPVDIMANGRLIARGEVLVLNDNFCVRISEILDPETTEK